MKTLFLKMTSFLLTPFANSAISESPLRYIDQNTTMEDIEITQSYGRENQYYLTMNFIAYGQKIRTYYCGYSASQNRPQEHNGIEEAKKHAREIIEILKNKDFSMKMSNLDFLEKEENIKSMLIQDEADKKIVIESLDETIANLKEKISHIQPSENKKMQSISDMITKFQNTRNNIAA